MEIEVVEIRTGKSGWFKAEQGADLAQSVLDYAIENVEEANMVGKIQDLNDGYWIGVGQKTLQSAFPDLTLNDHTENSVKTQMSKEFSDADKGCTEFEGSDGKKYILSKLSSSHKNKVVSFKYERLPESAEETEETEEKEED